MININGASIDKEYLRQKIERIFWKGSPTLTTGPQCEEESHRVMGVLEAIADAPELYERASLEFIRNNPHLRRK